MSISIYVDAGLLNLSKQVNVQEVAAGARKKPAGPTGIGHGRDVAHVCG